MSWKDILKVDEHDDGSDDRYGYWNSEQWRFDWENWGNRINKAKFYDEYAQRVIDRYTDETRKPPNKTLEERKKSLKDGYNKLTKDITDQFNWWIDNAPQNKFEGLHSYEHLMARGHAADEYKEYQSKKSKVDEWVNQNL